MPESIALPEVSPEIRARFNGHRSQIVNAVVARSLQRSAALLLPGEAAHPSLDVGLDYTIRALGVAMQTGSAELLRQQLIWANERLPHDGVAPQYVLTQLRLLAEVVRRYFIVIHADVVNQYVEFMIAVQAELVDGQPVP